MTVLSEVGAAPIVGGALSPEGDGLLTAGGSWEAGGVAAGMLARTLALSIADNRSVITRGVAPARRAVATAAIGFA